MPNVASPSNARQTPSAPPYAPSLSVHFGACSIEPSTASAKSFSTQSMREGVSGLLSAAGNTSVDDPSQYLKDQINVLRDQLLNGAYKKRFLEIKGRIDSLPAAMVEQVQDLLSNLNPRYFPALLDQLDNANRLPCCPLTAEAILKYPVWVMDKKQQITGPFDFEALLKQFLTGNFRTALRDQSDDAEIVQVFVSASTRLDQYVQIMRDEIKQFKQKNIPRPVKQPLTVNQLAPAPLKSPANSYSVTGLAVEDQVRLEKVRLALINHQIDFDPAESMHLFCALKPYDIVLFLDNTAIHSSKLSELLPRVSLIASVASAINQRGIEVFPVKAVQNGVVRIQDIDQVKSVDDLRLMNLMYASLAKTIVNSEVDLTDCFFQHLPRLTQQVSQSRRPVLAYIATTQSLGKMSAEQKKQRQAIWYKALERIFFSKTTGKETTHHPHRIRNRLSFLDCQSGKHIDDWMDELDNHPRYGKFIDTVGPYLREKRQVERVMQMRGQYDFFYSPRQDAKKLFMGAIDPILDASDEA